MILVICCSWDSPCLLPVLPEDQFCEPGFSLNNILQVIQIKRDYINRERIHDIIWGRGGGTNVVYGKICVDA